MRLEGQMSIWWQGRGRGRGRERSGGGRREGHVSSVEVHQEVPGDADQVQRPAQPPAPGAPLTLAPPQASPPTSRPWEVCPSQTHFLSPHRQAQAPSAGGSLPSHQLLVTPGV